MKTTARSGGGLRAPTRTLTTRSPLKYFASATRSASSTPLARSPKSSKNRAARPLPYQLVEPPEDPLVRVGRWPDPFKWPPTRPPALIDSGPSDHGRWDDPAGEFITLYTASDVLGAFVETLPYFRGPDPDFLALVHAEVDEDEPDVEVDYEFEVTPAFFKRVLGRAQLQDPHARFVDVDDPHTHAQLNRELPNLLAEHGLEEFDRGVMMSQNRSITRTIAGHLHHQLQGRDLGGTRVVGIRFESRR